MPFVPEKRRGLEFLDLPPDVCSMEEVEASLADIRVVNRYLGSRRALLKHLSGKVEAGAAITVLDVATGSADLPVAIVDWARERGIGVGITGVDINNRSIEIARKHAAGYPEIKLRVADGLNLPFPDGSFDFVLCSKTLHHLNEQDAVRMIGEIMRVARRGYVIMDLRRSWIAYALIYLLTRLFTGNRITRYDGPLSVLKSCTTCELAALASSAGAAEFTISREPFWLLVLSGEAR